MVRVWYFAASAALLVLPLFISAGRTAAQADGNDGAAAFTDQLAAFAAEEEQSHYPAALLVGAYLRTRR